MPKIEIDGLNISYQRHGTSGPTIVFLHGNSGCKEVFEQQFEHLKGSWLSLLAIDLPGHGASDNALAPETTYTIPGYAQIVNRALRELRVEKHMLVGWSLGGNIALEIAGCDLAEQNSKFRGMMICGAPPVGPGMEDLEKAYLPATFESAVGDADTPREQIEAYVKSIYGTLDPIPDTFYRCALRTEGVARENMVNHWFSGVSGYSQVETVSAWEKPICVVHGSLDVFVSLDYLQAAPWRNLWQREILELPNCGHAPFIEDAPVFNNTLVSFADDVL